MAVTSNVVTPASASRADGVTGIDPGVVVRPAVTDGPALPDVDRRGDPVRTM